MINKDGTIERLQESLKIVNRWCRTDSLDDPIARIESAMTDALELLKEQEPHLVTEEDFDIADNWGFIPAWHEEKTSGWMFWVTMSRAALDRSQYGPNNSCRYWTSRPTEEQRKAVKWDDSD